MSSKGFIDTLGIMLTKKYEKQFIQETIERYWEENGPLPNVRCRHPEWKGICQYCLGTNIPPIQHSSHPVE
ncbi:MAG: hypothetical protein MN733_22805 [Nitrososphaera sp.]|nr:hypothetical protein [Nitrososphaera sp.]